MNVLTQAHEQWATRPKDQRFSTLEELSAAVNRRRSISRERVTPWARIEAAVSGDRLVVASTDRGDSDELELTNWSFGQLSQRLRAPAGFLRELSPTTAAAVINERIRSSSGDMEEVNLMRLAEDDGGVLQAVTGPKYGRIWDADVVDMVGKIVERSNGKFHNPMAYSDGKFGAPPEPAGLYASDRDCFMFMIDGGSVFDAGPRAQFNKGLIVSNSEVGKSSLTIMTFLFNMVCGNHYVWGATEVNTTRIIHSSGGPARFIDQAYPTLMEMTSQDPNLDAVVRAQGLLLDDMQLAGNNFHKDQDSWVKLFAKSRDFTVGEVKEAIAVARREEGKCETVWDLAQGFTASAREISHADTRFHLERRAGKLLTIAI
jgi:hypothetical protein